MNVNPDGAQHFKGFWILCAVVGSALIIFRRNRASSPWTKILGDDPAERSGPQEGVKSSPLSLKEVSESGLFPQVSSNSWWEVVEQGKRVLSPCGRGRSLKLAKIRLVNRFKNPLDLAFFDGLYGRWVEDGTATQPLSYPHDLVLAAGPPRRSTFRSVAVLMGIISVLVLLCAYAITDSFQAFVTLFFIGLVFTLPFCLFFRLMFGTTAGESERDITWNHWCNHPVLKAVLNGLSPPRREYLKSIHANMNPSPSQLSVEEVSNILDLHRDLSAIPGVKDVRLSFQQGALHFTLGLQQGFTRKALTSSGQPDGGSAVISDLIQGVCNRLEQAWDLSIKT